MATKSIGTLKASLILDTRGFMLGFQKAGAVTKEATRTMGSFVAGAAKSVSSGFVGMAATAVASAAGIQAFANSFSSIDRQAKLADRLGIEMKSMQKLSAVSRITGADVELLAKAMLKMGETVGSGGKPLDQRFIEVATAISSIRDPIQRASRAAEVFGKQGATVLDAFAGNGAAIKQSADAVDRFGLALSRADASKIEAANDAMANLGIAISMVVNRLALEMAPTIERVANSAVDGMERFGQALDRVNVKWSTFADYAELWGDLISNPFSLSTATAKFITREPGMSKPGGGESRFSRLADIAETATKAPKPGAFEKGSKEAGAAIAEAGGSSMNPVVAELKNHGAKLDKIIEGVRKRPDAAEIRVVVEDL